MIFASDDDAPHLAQVRLQHERDRQRMIFASDDDALETFNEFSGVQKP